MLVVLTVILGRRLPAAVWGVGQAFGDLPPDNPSQWTVRSSGRRLIGQNFDGDQWFHSRPSPNDYDTLASAPSNLGPLNTDLIAAIEERRAAVAAAESVDPLGRAGRCPDRPRAQDWTRRSRPPTRTSRQPASPGPTGSTSTEVEDLIEENTQGRFLGFHGEPGVNVLELNVAVLRSKHAVRAVEGGD